MLLTLTGSDPGTMQGKKKKSFFKRAAKAALWTSPVYASYKIAQAMKAKRKREEAKRKEREAKKIQAEAQRKKAAAKQAAILQPTPENVSSEKTATIQAAAATAQAQTATKAAAEASAEAPAESEAEAPAESEAEETAESEAEETAESEPEESAQETAGEMAAQPKQENKIMGFLEKNKIPSIILAASLIFGIYYSSKKKK